MSYLNQDPQEETCNEVMMPTVNEERQLPETKSLNIADNIEVLLEQKA